MKFIFLILFGIASYANAWTLSSSTRSNMKGWGGSTLTFNLNPANCRSDIRSLLQDSFNLWNSIPNSYLKLELGSDTTTSAATAVAGSAPEAAVVICDSAFSTTYPSSDPNFVAGNGGNAVNSSSQIVKGVLVLNAQAGAQANINTLSENSAKVIVAHEIGHVLGLGHSSDAAALMYYSVGVKTNFALSEDDENGMAYLYGRKEVMGSNELLGGCGLLKNNWGGGPRGGGFLLALFLLPLCVAFQLRRKKLNTFV